MIYTGPDRTCGLLTTEIGRSLPSFSIVVEWENAGRIGAPRAMEMLCEVRRQLGEMTSASPIQAEVLIVYKTGDEGSRREIEHALSSLGETWPIVVRIEAVQTSDYYQQKNYGAELALNEIIVFLDSDVIPSTHWLQSLLSPFAHASVDVVAGSTSLGVSSIYSAAMAAGWIFPPNVCGSELSRTVSFRANNVAFRSDVLKRHPFPQTGQFRGQCGFLAATLVQAGFTILSSARATATHPPPEGLKPFISRALWAGYDTAILRRMEGKRYFWRGAAGIARDVAQSLWRVWIYRRQVGLNLVAIPWAMTILAAYQFVRSGAFAMSWCAPATTKRWILRFDQSVLIPLPLPQRDSEPAHAQPQ